MQLSSQSSLKGMVTATGIEGTSGSTETVTPSTGATTTMEPDGLVETRDMVGMVAGVRTVAIVIRAFRAC